MSDVPVSIAYGEEFTTSEQSHREQQLTAINDVLSILDSSTEIPFIKTVQ